MPSNEQAVSDWIKDGTPTEEPVTVETPVEPVAVEPAPPAEATALEPAAAPEPAPVPEPEYFVGRLNGEEYKVPLGFELPIKRGEDVEWVRLTESQMRTMMHKDYSIKTAEASSQRKDLERERREFVAQQARFEAQRTALEAERKELEEIRSDEGKYQAFLEHLDLMKNNPSYRKTAEEAVRGRGDRAELEALREAQANEAAYDAAQMAQGWIDEIAKDPRFASVDSERVRAIYADALTTGRLTDLQQGDVQKIFEQEAQSFQQRLAGSPLMKELDDLKAQLAALKEGRVADAHNAATTHALQRGKAPPLAPAGSPAAPVPGSAPGKRFGPNELIDKISEWNKI